MWTEFKDEMDGSDIGFKLHPISVEQKTSWEEVTLFQQEVRHLVLQYYVGILQ